MHNARPKNSGLSHSADTVHNVVNFPGAFRSQNGITTQVMTQMPVFNKQNPDFRAQLLEIRPCQVPIGRCGAAPLRVPN